MVSINKASRYYRDLTEAVGYSAINRFANLLDKEWKLIVGKDPSEVMEYIVIKFDFLVLDTAHTHPIESMNFLSVLP